MPDTLDRSAKNNRRPSTHYTGLWVCLNPSRFFLVVAACFLCSLALHLTWAEISPVQRPDLLMQSMMGCWLVGTVYAYFCIDFIAPAPAQKQAEPKKTSNRVNNLLRLLCLWLVWFGVIWFYFYLKENEENWLATSLKKTYAVTSDATANEDFTQENVRREFESVVATLLFVSADDTDRTSLAVTKPIDMSERRKFFSTSGWEDYQRYIVAQRRRLISIQGSSPVALKARSELKDGSRHYKTENGKQVFTAGGSFKDGAYTVLTPSEPFTLHVEYTDKTDSETLLIDAWTVRSPSLD